MSTFAVHAEHLVLPEGVVCSGYLVIEDGRFADVCNERPACDVVEYGDAWVSPGLVDTHIHGFADHDVMDCDPAGIDAMCEALARRGTTSILATTLTASLEQTALSHGIPVRSAAEGGTLTKGSLSFRILSPALSRPNEENDYSLVLLISLESFRGLFTGDIGAETEMQLIGRYGDLLRDLDYLKAAHHGSRFSSCEDFIRLTSPTFTVISCGRNNSYGHPHEETLERLREGESTALRTDLAGAVRVSVNEENSLTVECYRNIEDDFQENFPETSPLTAMHTMEGQINKRRRDEE